MGDTQNTYYDHTTPEPSLSSTTTSSTPSCVSEGEDAPPLWKKRSLSKQLSMREVPRNIAWERRRRQLRRRSDEDLTDEDLNELKGCIELGFGFNAEEGQRLCTTIPALDLYFAVNRHFLTSPLTSPSSGARPPQFGSPYAPTPPKTLSHQSCSFEKPVADSDSWKILSPGDDPQQVKTRLRHWAQAVACSVLQSPIRGGGMD